MKAGWLLATEGCLPTALGARVRNSSGKLTVTDGPFTEAKKSSAVRHPSGKVQGRGHPISERFLQWLARRVRARQIFEADTWCRRPRRLVAAVAACFSLEKVFRAVDFTPSLDVLMELGAESVKLSERPSLQPKRQGDTTMRFMCWSSPLRTRALRPRDSWM